MKMDHHYNIRPASKGDLSAARDLLAEHSLPLDGVDAFLECGYSVATYQETVVGLAGIEVYGSLGLLRSVAVKPGWQGQTIGEALVRNRLSWAEANGLSSVYLLTIDATDYFRRFGFEPVSRDIVPADIQKSLEFSSVCPATAAVMRRHIAAGA